MSCKQSYKHAHKFINRGGFAGVRWEEEGRQHYGIALLQLTDFIAYVHIYTYIFLNSINSSVDLALCLSLATLKCMITRHNLM